jgi:hypothetical protein
MTVQAPEPIRDDKTVQQEPRVGRRAALASALALVLMIGVSAGGLVACAAGRDKEDRVSERGTTGATSESATIQEALRFGDIALPPSAKVLGVREEDGQDRLFVLAITLAPNEIDDLLSGSGFTAQLRPGERVFMQPVEGFDPNAGSDITSGEDRLPADGDRAQGVNRTILVNRSDPAAPVVHMWLFTT